MFKSRLNKRFSVVHYLNGLLRYLQSLYALDLQKFNLSKVHLPFSKLTIELTILALSSVLLLVNIYFSYQNTIKHNEIVVYAGEGPDVYKNQLTEGAKVEQQFHLEISTGENGRESYDLIMTG